VWGVRFNVHKFTQFILVAGVLSGCATLPDVDPWLRFGGAAPSDTSAIRRPLTQEQTDAVLAKLTRKGDDSDILVRQAALEEAVAGTALIPGNDATLLLDGPATYKVMFEAIARASDHVHLEFYTIEDDETGRRLAGLLIEKRSQGVAVNLIYDAVGSIQTPGEYFARLRDVGVNVVAFNPVNPLAAKSGWRLNHRDHRKILIVDGRVAFTGGINISGVYSGGSLVSSARGGPGVEPGWRDTNVRIAGPVVADMQRVFLANWEKQHGESLERRNWFPELKPQGRNPARVIASSPDDAVPAIYVTLVSAIRNAARSVYLTTAYFAPDPQTLEALKGAAARGIEVKLILPSYTDFWGIFHAGRSHYSDLLEAGVEIYERQERLLHSKTAVIDGVWSTVGSSNIDWRSFLHNDELNVVILGPEFGKQMEDAFRRDLGDSRRIRLEEWERRPLDFRLKEWAARLWEYWL
jgi:cardiolipin synthase